MHGKSIGDVAKIVGVQTHTIRFWTTTFNHIKHILGPGNRRYYDEKAIAQLLRIYSLIHNHGMRIAGIKKLIKYGSISEDKISNLEQGNVDKNFGTISSKKIKRNEANDSFKEISSHDKNNRSNNTFINDQNDLFYGYHEALETNAMEQDLEVVVDKEDYCDAMNVVDSDVSDQELSKTECDVRQYYSIPSSIIDTQPTYNECDDSILLCNETILCLKHILLQLDKLESSIITCR